MTIGSLKPSTGNESRKNKQAIVDERSPLLPTKHSGDGGFDEFNGASFSGAVFNLSTTIVGAGIMALPATTKVLGLIPGVALIIFMAFLTESSIELLLRFSRTSKSVSYRGLMGDAFGDFGRMLIQLCVLVNNIGVLIVYMIIIGDVLSRTTSGGIHHAGVLEGWFGEHWWNGRFFVLLITTLAIFAPLASLKRIAPPLPHFSGRLLIPAPFVDLIVAVVHRLRRTSFPLACLFPVSMPPLISLRRYHELAFSSSPIPTKIILMCCSFLLPKKFTLVTWVAALSFALLLHYVTVSFGGVLCSHYSSLLSSSCAFGCSLEVLLLFLLSFVYGCHLFLFSLTVLYSSSLKVHIFAYFAISMICVVVLCSC